MNRILFSFLLGCCLLYPFVLRADVAIEGEVDIRVKVLNTSEFPGYEFYIEYQDYYYEYGWQPGGVAHVTIKENEEFETGERGGASKLYAVDAEGNVFETEEQIGGNQILDDYKASYIVQEIEITELRDGKIAFKVESEYKVYPGGETKKLRKGFVFFGFDVMGIDIGLILLPLVCLGGLLFFFWTRRNPMRPTPIA
jgi:hypothetical protein